MQLYNTLTRKKEEFEPRDGKKIQMFVCGPTVFDFSHLGHARTYIFYNTLAKYLKFKGYDVFYLQNITDIDDKIIDRAKQNGKDPLELSKEFAGYYFEDMKSLGIDSVGKYAPATEYIPQIISQVKRLLEKGFVYKIENDGIYFDLTKFPDYGKLSGRTTQNAEDAVSRIDESVNKKNRGDFALWKFSKEGEPNWPAEFGTGRPGWHIEDTAISETEFGSQYDLHGGALELIFPHHEAEVAQMEAISGKSPMVKYWVHTGLLTINGKKMSKSLGNFITIRDILKNYSPEVIRFMLLSSHYRSPMDFNEQLLKQSEAAVMRIAEFRNKFAFTPPPNESTTVEEFIAEAEKNIISALDDDFNIPKAFSVLFDMIFNFNNAFTAGNWNKKAISNAIRILNLLDKLGIVPSNYDYFEFPESIRKLGEQRENARKDGNYQKADGIRKEIEKLGYKIDDTPYGPLIKKK